MILYLCLGSICFSLVLGANVAREQRFPDDFTFGVTTAATTIEGAWNVDGRGESIWDYVAHKNPRITNGSNADKACESYYLQNRDIETIKELGLSNYRFSISWSRILPQGTTKKVNQKGIDYYNKLINELIANNIEPWVTMYHWDLPQALQNSGGWQSEKIANWFGDYARILYKNFGDRVKNWVTIHEPFIFCSNGYESGTYPPLVKSPGKGIYECGRNVLLANAKAYHIYQDEFKAKQNGRVGISLAIRAAIPASNSTDDISAAQDYMTFTFDQYMHPIYSDSGNYPRKMIERVAQASEGLHDGKSRLKSFSDKEVKTIKGTSDFLALSHFASRVVARNSSSKDSGNAVPSFDNDMNVVSYNDPSWPVYGIISVYLPGFTKVMEYVKDKYDNPLMYIASNGVSSYDSSLNDDFRVKYLQDHLQRVLDARANGVHVKGYFYWSLMDKFEWTSGYSTKYGLYQTEFSSNKLSRTPRKSAYAYKTIVRSKVIDLSINPDTSKPI